MYLLVQIEAGITELNWMWLPTWIGMSAKLKRELEEELSSALVGKTLEEANELVLDYLCRRFSIVGLRDYLDGLKFVQDTND